jgi:hypothetical protein
MVEDTSVFLAHSLVAVRAGRMRAFAERYGAMARAVDEHGRDAPESADAQRALVRLIDDYRREDHEAELREMVAIEGDELARLKAGARALLEFAEYAEDDVRESTERALRRAIEHVEPMPRAAALRIARSLRRFDRLRALDGPGFAFVNEAVLVACGLEDWKTPPAPWSDAIDWSFRPDQLLVLGTTAASVVDANGRRGVDLGLGLDRAADEIVGLSPAQYDALRACGPNDSLEAAVPEIAALPFVPPRRVHELGPSFVDVRDATEAMGPLGWADRDELVRLAAEYDALARAHPTSEASLRRVASALRDAHAAGHGVAGTLELMVPEAEGNRGWLVWPDED